MSDGERKEWPWAERAAIVCSTLYDLIEDSDATRRVGCDGGLIDDLLGDLDFACETLIDESRPGRDDDLNAEFLHRRKPIKLSDADAGVDDEGCGYIQSTAGGDEDRAAELLALAAVRGMALSLHVVRPEHNLTQLYMEMSCDLWLSQTEWNEVEAMVKAFRAALDARYTKRQAAKRGKASK